MTARRVGPGIGRSGAAAAAVAMTPPGVRAPSGAAGTAADTAPARGEAGDGEAPVIEAVGLASGYGERTVWGGADFRVAPGEFLTVLGPNGAGKSTLLRMVLGLRQPLAGRLEVFGRAPRRGDPAIGYVPQRRTLDPHLGVGAADLVGLGVDGHRWGMRLSRRVARERRDAVHDALAEVGATDYARRAVGRLSGGEQQRLLMAQALVSRPRLLLLDEPLASLDLRNQTAVSELVGQLRDEHGFAVVLVTHDINPVLTLTDRVMYIAGGRVSVGPPREVITGENLSRLYGTDVEVLTDRRGRVFVVASDEAPAGVGPVLPAAAGEGGLR